MLIPFCESIPKRKYPFKSSTDFKLPPVIFLINKNEITWYKSSPTRKYICQKEEEKRHLSNGKRNFEAKKLNQKLRPNKA